jgi:UDP-glucose 4-epimerase
MLNALHLAEKLTVAVPHPLAYALSDFLWASGVGLAPGAFVDYVRFLCVADGEKARRVLGFQARHRSRDALVAYLAYRYPDTAVRPEEAQA